MSEITETIGGDFAVTYVAPAHASPVARHEVGQNTIGLINTNIHDQKVTDFVCLGAWNKPEKQRKQDKNRVSKWLTKNSSKLVTWGNDAATRSLTHCYPYHALTARRMTMSSPATPSNRNLWRFSLADFKRISADPLAGILMTFSSRLLCG